MMYKYENSLQCSWRYFLAYLPLKKEDTARVTSEMWTWEILSNVRTITLSRSNTTTMFQGQPLSKQKKMKEYTD